MDTGLPAACKVIVYDLEPDTAKICCSQTEMLLPPQIKSAVFCFLEVFCKNERIHCFQNNKNVLRPKIVESFTILNIFELVFLGEVVY